MSYALRYTESHAVVMTKIKERDGVTKYIVDQRVSIPLGYDYRSCLISSLQPILLDLLTLVNCNDPPIQRGTGLLRGLRGGLGEAVTPNSSGASPDTANDSRYVYPVTLHHNGRIGVHLLYAESQQARMEWKTKLDQALVSRRVVRDSNKVFEIETLSADTFLLPSLIGAQQSWNQEVFTGKVSCSVSFSKPHECTKEFFC